MVLYVSFDFDLKYLSSELFVTVSVFRVFFSCFDGVAPTFTLSRPLYAVLGVDQNASHDQINRAFRELTQKW